MTMLKVIFIYKFYLISDIKLKSSSSHIIYCEKHQLSFSIIIINGTERERNKAKGERDDNDKIADMN